MPAWVGWPALQQKAERQHCNSKSDMISIKASKKTRKDH